MKKHYAHNISATNMERLVGSFIILPALIVIIFFAYKAVNTRILDDNFQIKAVFSNGEGLKNGTDVTISGIKIGQVESVEINEQNSIDVLLDIDIAHQKKVTVMSKATLGKKGLLGENIIIIIPGKFSEKFLQDGAEIPVVESVSFQDITAKIIPVLDQAEKALTTIAKVINDIDAKSPQKIVENIESITSSINRGEGTIGALVKSSKLFDNLNATAEKVSGSAEHINDLLANANQSMEMLPEILTNFKQTTDQLNKELFPLMENLSATLTDIRKTTTELPELAIITKKTVGDLQDVTQLAPSIITDAQASLDNVEELTEKLLTMSERLEKTFGQVSDELPAILDNIQTITQNAKIASDDVPEITRGTNDIVEGAKKIWPLSTQIHQKREINLPGGGSAADE